MLRMLFGEKRRVDEGVYLEVCQQLSAYLKMIRTLQQSNRINGLDEHRLEIWAKGFATALDELEQSLYCCKRFADRIHSQYVEAMKQPERDDYHRHLYFYKDGFIRVFSILDKLGVFLDSRLQLQTKNMKPKFSYFTVLRNMFQNHLHQDLQNQLFEDKQRCKESLNRLRRQRNMEIHAMNVELIDDMQQTEYAALSCLRIEDCRQHVSDLECAYDMVGQALKKSFAYLVKHEIG